MAIESTGDNTLLVNIDANVTSQGTTINTINTNVSSTLTVAQSIQTSAGKIVYAVFTASGTWTRPSGVNVINAFVVGGGGGGGPAVASQRNGTTQGPAAAGGGGAGGQVINYGNIYVGAYSSLTVTIGAGGSGGSVSGNGTSSATVTYQSNGSNTTITNGTTTLASAIGGSYGGGMRYLGGTGVFGASGTPPKLNGRNLGGRGVAADVNTTSTSWITYLQGGTGAGGNSDGLTGLLDVENHVQTPTWDGAGKLLLERQSPFAMVSSGSNVQYRAKISWSNGFVESSPGGNSQANFKTQMYNTKLSLDSATWDIPTHGDAAILDGQTYKSQDYYGNKTFFHSELMASSRGEFVAGLPVQTNYSISSYGDSKHSLSIPGPSLNGYGNGGWGGIIYSSDISSSSHNLTTFPGPSTFLSFGGTSYNLHTGPYESKVTPARVMWDNSNTTASAAGTNAIANTGDGGGGAAVVSYTASTIVTAVKGGDGGSGICIISYSV